MSVHYTGKLKDGTEFDTSAGRGKSETTVSAHTVPGFQFKRFHARTDEASRLVPIVPTCCGLLEQVDRVEKLNLRRVRVRLKHLS